MSVSKALARSACRGQWIITTPLLTVPSQMAARGAFLDAGFLRGCLIKKTVLKRTIFLMFVLKYKMVLKCYFI